MAFSVLYHLEDVIAVIAGRAFGNIILTFGKRKLIA
jgi:hypothetical protein